MSKKKEDQYSRLPIEDDFVTDMRALRDVIYSAAWTAAFIAAFLMAAFFLSCGSGAAMIISACKAVQ